MENIQFIQIMHKALARYKIKIEKKFELSAASNALKITEEAPVKILGVHNLRTK